MGERAAAGGGLRAVVRAKPGAGVLAAGAHAALDEDGPTPALAPTAIDPRAGRRRDRRVWWHEGDR